MKLTHDNIHVTECHSKSPGDKRDNSIRSLK